MDFKELKDKAKVIKNNSGIVINGNCENTTIDNRHLEITPALQNKIFEIENTVNEICKLLKDQEQTIKEQNIKISKLLELMERQ